MRGAEANSAGLALSDLIAGCGEREPVHTDGRSQASFERSADEAPRELHVADRIVFDRAVRSVGGRRFANRDPARLVRLTFDNMTAAEVVIGKRTRER